MTGLKFFIKNPSGVKILNVDNLMSLQWKQSRSVALLDASVLMTGERRVVEVRGLNTLESRAIASVFFFHHNSEGIPIPTVLEVDLRKKTFDENST